MSDETTNAIGTFECSTTWTWAACEHCQYGPDPGECGRDEPQTESYDDGEVDITCLGFKAKQPGPEPEGEPRCEHTIDMFERGI